MTAAVTPFTGSRDGSVARTGVHLLQTGLHERWEFLTAAVGLCIAAHVDNLEWYNAKLDSCCSTGKCCRGKR
jgi:hypothetical protein